MYKISTKKLIQIMKEKTGHHELGVVSINSFCFFPHFFNWKLLQLSWDLVLINCLIINLWKFEPNAQDQYSGLQCHCGVACYAWLEGFQSYSVKYIPDSLQPLNIVYIMRMLNVEYDFIVNVTYEYIVNILVTVVTYPLVPTLETIENQNLTYSDLLKFFSYNSSIFLVIWAIYFIATYRPI